MSNNNSISAEEFDRIFDDGEEDVLQYFDTDNIRRPGRETRTVAVDLPVRVLEAVEQQSQATGSTSRVFNRGASATSQNESGDAMKDKAWFDSEELDRIFDEGKEDVLQYFDLSNVEVFGEDEPAVKETKPNEGTT